MPTYEYQCKDCGNDLEVVQSFSDDALTECPTCGGKLKKIFGNIGISFKGSGFYKNDSRSDSGGGAGERAARENAHSQSSTDGGSSDSSSSDSSSSDSSSTSSKSTAETSGASNKSNQPKSTADVSS